MLTVIDFIQEKWSVPGQTTKCDGWILHSLYCYESLDQNSMHVIVNTKVAQEGMIIVGVKHCNEEIKQGLQ